MSVLVTGGASGLGRATAERLLAAGAFVVIADLPTSGGQTVAAQLGDRARFVPADVTDAAQVEEAIGSASKLAPFRATVHCAGRGGSLRIVDKNGNPGSLELFESVIRTNLIGTFNVLRLTAAEMIKVDEVEGERGVVVLTASVAAYEGQIGQVPYASSKAAVVGMTIVAARDLASRKIRVCTIAPGTFDTPILDRIPPDIRDSLAKATPHPARLGRPPEFAMLAAHIIENPMLNGETIRLDGAIRMSPR
jgi:NAD(P)-dependent dehydrogenase (short-subunit alcohol dehydrogenase family)